MVKIIRALEGRCGRRGNPSGQVLASWERFERAAASDYRRCAGGGLSYARSRLMIATLSHSANICHFYWDLQ